MPVTQKDQGEFRHERKFLITGYAHADVEQMIKLHPACFKEIFHRRTVNNIYFDTLGFDNLYDNIEGEKDRLKARIRWYGDLSGEIKNPVLELKIKKGLLGEKKSFPLNSFILDTSFSKEQILQSLARVDIPVRVRNMMHSLKPAILNRYDRKYFLSRDGQFRITIDWNLTYYRINYGGTTFLNKTMDHLSTVLELKYDAAMEIEATQVGNAFPFALTKSSKYVQGMEQLFF